MKKYIFFISMIVLFSSCLQNRMAVKQLLKTAMTSDHFKRPLTDVEFQRLLTNTKTTPKSSNDCLPDYNKILDDSISDELKAITNNVCSCHPWGTCTVATCSCEMLCPDSLKIFHNPAIKTGSYFRDFLSFDNFDVNLLKGGSNGYCWGISTVTQKFQKLARFKPFEASPFPLDNTFNPDRKKYFRDIISKISKNEVVSIPGFNNLYEFSEHPEIKELLVEQIKKEWVQNAMTDQGVRMTFKKNPMTADEFNKLADDIKKRTDHFIGPTLIINFKDGVGAHTIQVIDVKIGKDGSKKLCVYDNNLAASSTSHCNNFIKLIDGKIVMTSNSAVTINNHLYSNYHEMISNIEITHSEDPSIALQAAALKKECSSEKKVSCD